MPSVRFVLTDEELIVDFLKPHVLSGRPLPCDAIRATDVYAKDPWELVGDREDEAHFITRRSRTTKGSSWPRRTILLGTWKMEKQVDVSDESGVVIRRKALLSFHFGKKRKASGWVMHDFLLGSVVDDDERVPFQETALCRIRGKRGRRHDGGAIAKRSKISLGEDEPSSSFFVMTTTTVSHHHHHPPQFLDVGSSLVHGSESEMMVLSLQSVLERSPPSSILVQPLQQEEDYDGDVAPPLASNPICERSDQEDGGGADHKVSAVVGGFTDLLLGPDDDGDQQLAIDFNQMTAEQWDMFCNFATCLEGSTSTSLG